MDYEIDVSREPDHMKGYHIVRRLYEIRDEFLLTDETTIEYNELIMNEKILSLIDEINFIYVKGWEDDKEKGVYKVGNLLNFKVYINKHNDNFIDMFHNGKEKISIKIKL